MAAEVRFAEVRRFLEQHGYELDRIRGSRHAFQKSGAPPINFPVREGRRVLPVYIRKIEKTLGVEFR